MSPSNCHRRTTMVISALIAAAILGAAVTAQHGHRPPLGELAELEADLRMQLQMAFRHDTSQYETRLEQLHGVLGAWLQSSRSPAARQLLSQWLRQAIRCSMPGSTQPLPPLPVFDMPVPHGMPAKSTPADSPAPGVSDNRPRALPAPLEIAPNHPRPRPSPRAPSAPALAAPTGPEAPMGSTASAATIPGPPASPRPVSAPSREVTGADTNPSRNQNLSSQRRPGLTAATGTSAARTQVTRFTTRATPGSSTNAQPAMVLTEPPPTAEISINLAELAARTAGYHDGLNEIEAALYQLCQPHGQSADSRQKLASARRSLSQLEQLVDDYQFIKLYDGLLTEPQRRTIPAPRSPASLCERFSLCLDQWAAPREEDYLRSFDQELSKSQQAALQSLRDNLAELASQLKD